MRGRSITQAKLCAQKVGHLERNLSTPGIAWVHTSSELRSTNSEGKLCVWFYSKWYLNSVWSLCISQEIQVNFEFASKMKTIFNVAHFSFDPRLVLRSDHHRFLSSFKAALKKYFTLLTSFICRYIISCAFTFYTVTICVYEFILTSFPLSI